jgi:hypothetical protein
MCNNWLQWIRAKKRPSPVSQSVMAKKSFKLDLPLPINETYLRLQDRCSKIDKWVLTYENKEEYVIKWSQSFLAATGWSKITANLIKSEQNETIVRVVIHRPLQLWDPAKMCERVFKKFQKAVEL